MNETDQIQTTAEASEAAALPSARVVHANPNAPKTAELQPLPDKVANTPVDKKSAAEWAYQRVILYIKNFEEQLDSEHEIAMGFTGSNTGILRIEGVGYFDPDIVTFYGSDENGAKTQLVQHVTQLNVMLRAMPKQVPMAEPQRIGFRLAADLEESDSQPEG